MRIIAYIYMGMSLATLLAYGWDKWAAIRQARRTPERTLHICALLGGWPGSLAGMQLFKHKRRKRGFLWITWLIVTVHALLWGAWLVLSNRG